MRVTSRTGLAASSLLNGGNLLMRKNRTGLNRDNGEPVSGRSMQPELNPHARQSFPWGYLALALIFTLGIIAGGFFFFRNHQAEIRRTTHETLAAIADLKAGEIASWVQERRNNANAFLHNDLARQFLEEPDNPALQEELLHWITETQKIYGYTSVTLFDSDCRFRMSSPETPFIPDSIYIQSISSALSSKEVVFIDLHGGHTDHPIHMSFLVPVGVKPNTDQMADGVVLFVIDPYQFLYPLVQSWPSPSPSAETLIFRREGDEVLFLNDLRHMDNTALQMRLPIDDNLQYPATMAAEGIEGVVEGIDYRGIPVLGAISRVPGTPWYMVAKVDQKEIYAPLRQQAWIITLTICLLIVVAILVIGLIWRHQKQAYSRKANEALRKNESFLNDIIEQSPFSIWISDSKGVLLRLNRACRELLQITEEEVVGKYNILEDSILIEQDVLPLVKKVYEQGESVRFILHYDSSQLTELPLQRTVNRILDTTIFPIKEPSGGLTNAVIQHIDITDKYMAEKALLLTNLVFEASITANSISGVDGTITKANSAFLRLWGYEKMEEVLGRPISDFMQNSKKALKITNALNSLGQWEGNYTAKRKDGSIFTAHGLATVVLDKSENVLGYQSAVLDITEQEEMEETLRRSESKLKMAQIVAGIGDFTWEIESGSVKWSDGMHDLLKYDKMESIDYSRINSEIHHPEDRAMVNEWFSEGMASGKEFLDPKEYRLVCRDGQVIHVLTNARIEYRGSKAFILFGTCLDITKRKTAELELAAEKERLAVTLRSIGDGVITTDVNGNITMLNKAAEALTGWESSEASGQPLLEVFRIINENTGLQCTNPVEKVLATGEVVELENHTCLIAKDGRKRAIADSGAPIRDSSSKTIGVVLVFRDMTEKYRHDSSMRRAQKLESLGVIAGGIAHDFNNILGGVFGYIELALGETVEMQVSSYLTESLRNIERARALTQQLLTFAKGGAPIKRVENLFPFVQNTANFALSGSSVSSSFQIQEILWVCDFDKNQIGQVIDNLTINAQQAMPKGGLIEFSASNVSLSRGEHPSLPAGKYVKLSVKDHGVGIPKEFLPHIFEPYYTTKPKGHGLGLSTCYSIINRHGGCIDVESQSGKGSVFHLYLPASPESEPAVKRASGEGHKGSGVFLVMDDEKAIRGVFKRALESFGYTVVLFENGKDALEFIREESEAGRKFTGMMFDLTVPGGMGGEEAIREIRKIFPDIPVFVASGYSQSPIMANPEEYGFTASICKPFMISELAEMLEQAHA